MSHITTIKTKVTLKDEGLLLETLNEMQRTLQGFSVEQTTTGRGERQLLVRYAPIETYQKQGNLRFIQKEGGGTWEMRGDSYECRHAFKDVTDQVLVGYQMAALKRVMIRNRYSTQTNTLSASHVSMHARRF